MLTVWAPSGIENYFNEAAQPLPDLSHPPLPDPKHKELFVALGPKYGITQSSSFNQYIDTVDSNFPDAVIKDNHADELLALLSPDVKAETKLDLLGKLALIGFSALGAIVILKRVLSGKLRADRKRQNKV